MRLACALVLSGCAAGDEPAPAPALPRLFLTPLGLRVTVQDARGDAAPRTVLDLSWDSRDLDLVVDALRVASGDTPVSGPLFYDLVPERVTLGDVCLQVVRLASPWKLHDSRVACPSLDDGGPSCRIGDPCGDRPGDVWTTDPGTRVMTCRRANAGLTEGQSCTQLHVHLGRTRLRVLRAERTGSEQLLRTLRPAAAFDAEQKLGTLAADVFELERASWDRARALAQRRRAAEASPDCVAYEPGSQLSLARALAAAIRRSEPERASVVCLAGELHGALDLPWSLVSAAAQTLGRAGVQLVDVDVLDVADVLAPDDDLSPCLTHDEPAVAGPPGGA